MLNVICQSDVHCADGATTKTVAAAGDETRKGEAEMDAPLKAKP
jgi:hypothetical protein